MSAGYLSQVLVDFCGIDCFSRAGLRALSSRRLHKTTRLLRKAGSGTSVMENNGTRLVLEIWCRNVESELSTVGAASAVVSR